jgi:hypothetical protein
MTNTSIAIEKHIEDLSVAISKVDRYFEIFWSLKEKENVAKYRDIKEKYDGFFYVVDEAIFIAIIVILYRLYETNGSKASIPSLITRLSSEGKLSEGNWIPQEFKEKLEQEIKLNCTDTIKGIRIIRNDVYAHRSKRYERFDELFEKANIKYDNLKDLIDYSREILNQIIKNMKDGITLSNECFAYTYQGLNTRALLDDLKEHNDNKV